MPYMPISPSNI